MQIPCIRELPRAGVCLMFLHVLSCLIIYLVTFKGTLYETHGPSLSAPSALNQANISLLRNFDNPCSMLAENRM